MGATNSTPNIQLPSFIGTDKPSWLGDWNSAMTKIDTKFGTVDGSIGTVTNTANAAQTAAEAASQAVTTLQGTVTQHTSEISDVMADVSGLEADVTQLQSSISSKPNFTIGSADISTYDGGWSTNTNAAYIYTLSIGGIAVTLLQTRNLIRRLSSNYAYVGFARIPGNVLYLPPQNITKNTLVTANVRFLGELPVLIQETDTVSHFELGLAYDASSNFTFLIGQGSQLTSGFGAKYLINIVGTRGIESTANVFIPGNATGGSAV